MTAPSSRHLTHDFPAYRGLSLRELFTIILVSTALFFLLFLLVGFITGWVVACACLGILSGFICAVSILPKPIASLKAGKPHGYLKKRVIIKLAALGVIQSPYLTYQGAWQKNARVRRFHV